MWIRSQDKKRLMKCEYIEAYKTMIFVSTNGENWEIGAYSTEEKALKVLDKMETFIDDGQNKIITIDEDGFERLEYKAVFQMPADEDV